MATDELSQWLKRQTSDRVELTFAQVKQILALSLPSSCRVHLAHWYGFDGGVVARIIYDAGGKSTEVSFEGETVVFVPRWSPRNVEGRLDNVSDCCLGGAIEWE